MQRKSLWMLLSFALLLGALLVWLQRGDGIARQAERQLLLPALAGQLEKVRALEIRHGELPRIRIVREGDAWVVPDKAGYPAAAGEVNRLLRALAAARKVEAKTRNPDNHARLGLAEAGEGAATRLTLEGLGGAPQVLLIGQASRQGGQLVRWPDDAQVWLVDQPLALVDNELAWLDRRIAEIPFASVREVAVRHADGERLRAGRDSAAQFNLNLLDLPAGRRLAYEGALNSMAALFSSLDFADAASLAQVAFDGRSELEFVVRTFAGGELQGRFYLRGGQHWLVLGESRGLGAQLIGQRDWAYRLEAPQYAVLARRTGELLAPRE